MQTRNYYRQGIIKTSEHLMFNEGQIVDIMEEDKDHYWVRAIFPNSPKIKIKKEFLKID
jgi:hypothetical protein